MDTANRINNELTAATDVCGCKYITRGMGTSGRIVVAVVIAVMLLMAVRANARQRKGGGAAPRIINIVNFIRQTDYRIANSDSLMFEAVKKQIALVNDYGFPATFLFQYDALINPQYQRLMKTALSPRCEIGAWWEITEPHVKAAGIKWRGEHSWVSTANIAFTPGYTIEERERLVDVYMQKFMQIYGRYPKSVGSWYIDSHTLDYMYRKYGIVASCNCKDQIGTDGYTLWGGYWNQAYYPSKLNAYMPAQTDGQKIPVPVFRMLGSDPIYQYDNGIGTDYQGVISLEPVYGESGRSRKWVEYFLSSLVDGPCLAFGYAQAGQENSFTWPAMSEGLRMQFALFRALSDSGKIRIETLEESGRWFRKHFTHTPATAVTTMSDVRGLGNKSVWYNSRFYRANLYWENDGFCFRDIHLFDEDMKSEYLHTPGTGRQFLYYTLPLVDRFHWSTPDEHVGLRIVHTSSSAVRHDVVLSSPVVEELSAGVLKVTSADADGHTFVFTLHEDRIELTSADASFDWALELRVPPSRADRLPFRRFGRHKIDAEFRGYGYRIKCRRGTVVGGSGNTFALRLVPERGRIVVDCAR